MVHPITRRKYEITARMNERDYPHMSGVVSAVWTLPSAFLRHAGVPATVPFKYGQGRNDDGQFYVRYCFGDPVHADAFRVGSGASD